MESTFGGFEIEGEIGRGGMGVVYRVRQVSLDREVALKVLRPALEPESGLVERFRAEAQAGSRISHPNLVEVYDVGCEGGRHYIAMELVEGESLASLIRREGSMGYPRAAAITSQMATALGALHGVGVVHRDVKPSNVLLGGEGVVKLGDFGVALLQQGGGAVTGEGMTVGTAHYMSPEQARGEELDGRSDIYALGVVLYELLTGHVPFGGEGVVGVMRAHGEAAVPSIRRERPDVPERLVEVVNRCLSKEPSGRYQRAEALSGELDHVRLELEFAALSGEVPSDSRPSLYSTRAVEAMKRQRAGRASLLLRLSGWFRRVLLSSWHYLAGTRDRDVMALRKTTRRMERGLQELAAIKQRRSALRQRAEELRRRAEAARIECGEAFDADELTRAEELAEEERRCNEAAIDFETTAESLTNAVRKCEERYERARKEHRRLRLELELRQARRIRGL
ncbi:MAG: serine/threonine-protein kinase [Planctomycetota bacterium]